MSIQDQQMPPVTKPSTNSKPKIEDLEPIAKKMIEELKVKYKKGNTPRALEIAGDKAIKIWRKSAIENTATGKAQLEPFDLTSGVSSLERYYMQNLPEVR